MSAGSRLHFHSERRSSHVEGPGLAKQRHHLGPVTSTFSGVQRMLLGGGAGPISREVKIGKLRSTSRKRDMPLNQAV